MFNSFDNPYFQAANNFSGQKQNRQSFPTDPNLSLDQYPDVTSHFEDAKYGMYRNLVNTHHWNTPEGITGLFREKMNPKGPWDLASQPQFPGTNAEGKTEYAKLNDQVVTGDFLNHHLLGHGLAGAGLSLTSEEPEKRVSPQQFPTSIWDADAVHRGYRKYMGDPGWKDSGFNDFQKSNLDSSQSDLNKLAMNKPNVSLGQVNRTSKSSSNLYSRDVDGTNTAYQFLDVNNYRQNANYTHRVQAERENRMHQAIRNGAAAAGYEQYLYENDPDAYADYIKGSSKQILKQAGISRPNDEFGKHYDDSKNAFKLYMQLIKKKSQEERDARRIDKTERDGTNLPDVGPP